MFFLSSLRTALLAFALTALPLATVVTIATPDAAFANNGNGNGNGGGGNGGGGNGGDKSDNGKSASNGKPDWAGKPTSKSAKSENRGKRSGLFGLFRKKPVPQKTAAASRPAKPVTRKSIEGYAPVASIAPKIRPGGNGRYAMKIKGLNAANASLTAYVNASPNSRVGRIATYRGDYKDLLDYVEATSDELIDISDLLADYQTDYVDNPHALRDAETGELLSQEDLQDLVDAFEGDVTSPEYEALTDQLDATIAADASAARQEEINDEIVRLEDVSDQSLIEAAAPNEAPSGEALEYFKSLLRLDEPLPEPNQVAADDTLTEEQI